MQRTASQSSGPRADIVGIRTDLRFHPHVHAIVSAGGLRVGEPSHWVRGRPRDLFPVKVMAELLRRLFRTALLHAIETGVVTVPSECAATLERALFDKRWVVYAKAPFGGAEQIFAYLGRYTHRAVTQRQWLWSTLASLGRTRDR